MTKQLIEISENYKDAYLNSLQKVKLIDKDSAFGHL